MPFGRIGIGLVIIKLYDASSSAISDWCFVLARNINRETEKFFFSVQLSLSAQANKFAFWLKFWAEFYDFLGLALFPTKTNQNPFISRMFNRFPFKEKSLNLCWFLRIKPKLTFLCSGSSTSHIDATIFETSPNEAFGFCPLIAACVSRKKRA